MVWRVLEVLCNALCNALDTDIPEGQISYQRPEGGYFVWVTFPPEVDCDKLSKVWKSILQSPTMTLILLLVLENLRIARDCILLLVNVMSWNTMRGK